MITWGTILWLKRRNGKGTALALVPDQAHSPAVLYHMMAQMLDEVKDFRDEQRYLSARLSEMHEAHQESVRENRLYHQAHERAGRQRHRLTKQRAEDHLEATLAAVETIKGPVVDMHRRMSA